MGDREPSTGMAHERPAESNAANGSAAVENGADDSTATAENSANDGTAAVKNTENSETVTAGDDAKDTKTEESSPDRKDNYKGDRQHGGHFKGRGGGRGRDNHRGGGHQSGGKSRRNEYEGLPDSDDPEEIRAQVEFYFSNQNLSTDEHLFMELKGPENRPVPIKHLNSFTRMRRFKPYSAIVDALRGSEDLIVVDEGEYSGLGNEGVKRKEPIVIPAQESDEKKKPELGELFYRLKIASMNSMEASVYVKGFVEEGDDVGQLTLEHFFKPYGAVMVRKRRDKEDHRRWKGSVFVEFDSEESQQQFLGLEPKPKFNGRDLMIMSKKAYSEMKCKEKGITPQWEREGSNYRGSNGYRRGRGGGRGYGGGRGGNRGGYRDGKDRFGRDRRDDRKRRNRSGSPHGGDSADWNERRDRFQKREADDSEAADAPSKKTKIEIKEDE